MKKPLATAALTVLLVLAICLAAVLMWRPSPRPQPSTEPSQTAAPAPTTAASTAPSDDPSESPSDPPSDPPSTAPATSVASPALDTLRQSAKAEGALVAVAYLGYSEEGGVADFLSLDPQAARYRESYPFLFDLPDSRHVERTAFGSEVYAVVAVDPAATVTVNEWVLDASNEWAGAAGKQLYRGGSDPLILRGNISDIIPNLLVTVTDSAGRTVEYSPCLSLRDGSLMTEDGVYDFTLG